MKITTNKQLRRLIYEVISSEEKSWFGNGISVLSEMSPESIKEFVNSGKIEKIIGPKLGEGVFREVYAVNDNPDVILKIIKHLEVNDFINVESRRQNKDEKKLFNTYPEIFPKVYVSDDDGYWMVVERVIPILTGTSNRSEDEKRVALIIMKSFPSFKILYDFLEKKIMVNEKLITSFFVIYEIFTKLLRFIGILFNNITIEDTIFDKNWGILTGFNFASKDANNLINLNKSELDNIIVNVIGKDNKLINFLKILSILGSNDLHFGNLGTNKDMSKIIVLDFGVGDI